MIPSQAALAKLSRLRRLEWLRVPLDQLVAVMLFFLPGRFLAELGQAFEQTRKFGFVPGFSQRLDQVIHRCLVLRIYVQSCSALVDGLSVLSCLQIKFREEVV